MKPAYVVAALELLALLLIAGGAGVAGWVHVEPAVGLLAAGIVVFGGSWLIERNFTASDQRATK